MLTKRSLKCLEGLLLLISLSGTASKRKTAAQMEISVDTVTKYVVFLEACLGCKLLINHHNCTLTAKAKELVEKSRNIYAGNWLPAKRDFNLLNLKNLRGIFYLKTIAFYGNKRHASQMLASSVETINAYIENLEKTLGCPLMRTDNHGSYPTFTGKKLLLKSDNLLNILACFRKNGRPDKEKKIRLALSREIDATLVASLTDGEPAFPDIMIFADDPNLHCEDWDIAITYSVPEDSDLVIVFQKEIPCGFFASPAYLDKFGQPKDVSDMQKNHRILDGSGRPYADKKYRSMMQNCCKVCPINNINIILTDMARYGAGICIVPLTISQNNLIYLEDIPCEAKATLYLSVHKDIRDIQPFQEAIDNYSHALAQI